MPPVRRRSGGGVVPPLPNVYLPSRWQNQPLEEAEFGAYPYTYAQIFDLKAVCPPEVLSRAGEIARAGGVAFHVDEGSLHVFCDADGDMAVARNAVAEVMVGILNKLLDAGVLDEDDIQEPHECLWPLAHPGPAVGGMSPPPFGDLSPAPRLYTALDLLKAFGGRQPFRVFGAEAIGNKTRDDGWAWLAISFASIANAEWIAENVDAHISLTYGWLIRVGGRRVGWQACGWEGQGWVAAWVGRRAGWASQWKHCQVPREVGGGQSPRCPGWDERGHPEDGSKERRLVPSFARGCRGPKPPLHRGVRLAGHSGAHSFAPDYVPPAACRSEQAAAERGAEEAGPSILPSGRPSDRPSVRPSARSSIPPSVRPSTRPSAHLSIHPFVRPSVHPSVRPSLRPSIQPSVIQFLGGWAGGVDRWGRRST